MTFLLKRIKTIIVLSVKEKDLSAFSLIKKNTLHYDKNWLLRTTKIICENKNKGLMSQWSNKQFPEIRIDIIFSSYDLLHLKTYNLSYT